MGSNGEKSNIAIAILEKGPFLKGTKNISHIGGISNIIFTECRLVVLFLSLAKFLSIICNVGWKTYRTTYVAEK